MSQEKYKPTAEDIKNAYEAMTPEQLELSWQREKESRGKERGRGFSAIDTDVINSDPDLRDFLLEARVSKSKKGDGLFISGAYGADTAKFRKYGIPVQGALIIPAGEDVEAELYRVRDVVAKIRDESDKTRTAEYGKLFKEDLEQRKGLERQYTEQVQRLLDDAHLDDLKVEIVDDGTKRNGYLKRGEEQVLEIIREGILHDGFSKGEKFESWHAFTKIETVAEFIAKEAKLEPLREKFKERLLKLEAITKESDWGVDSDDVKLYPTLRFIDDRGGNRRSVDSFELIRYDEKTYELSEENVIHLEQLITEKKNEILKRRDRLWGLFQGANGVFTKREVGKSVSGYRGEGKVDEWTETIYAIDGEELTPSEHEWLKAKMNELSPIPQGYYRVPNDTNDVRPMIYPRSGDILEVFGQTGDSRRGVIPTGVLYRGKPENYEVSVRSKRIHEIKLNGKKITSQDSQNFRAWNEHIERAKRAVQEIGESPEPGEAEALAEAYKKQSAKPTDEDIKNARESFEESIASKENEELQRLSQGINEERQNKLRAEVEKGLAPEQHTPLSYSGRGRSGSYRSIGATTIIGIDELKFVTLLMRQRERTARQNIRKENETKSIPEKSSSEIPVEKYVPPSPEENLRSFLKQLTTGKGEMFSKILKVNGGTIDEVTDLKGEVVEQKPQSFWSGSRNVQVQGNKISVYASGSGNLLQSFELPDGLFILNRNGEGGLMVERDANNNLSPIKSMSELVARDQSSQSANIPETTVESKPKAEVSKPVSEGGEPAAEDKLQALRNRFKK